MWVAESTIGHTSYIPVLYSVSEHPTVMCLRTRRAAASLCTINSLPHELLGVIQQNLPWRDRLRVEAVNRHWRRTALTQGWSHIRHFANDDYALNGWEETSPDRISYLLDRCAVFVESVRLQDITCWISVVKLLDKCPRVKRISVRMDRIDAGLVDYLSERCERSGQRNMLRYDVKLHS